MPSADIVIVREGDPAPWTDLDRETLIHSTEPFRVALLEAGMASGKPSVALRFDLPDGRALVSETSLEILVSVMAGARGAFPEVFAGGPFAP